MLENVGWHPQVLYGIGVHVINNPLKHNQAFAKVEKYWLALVGVRCYRFAREKQANETQSRIYSYRNL